MTPDAPRALSPGDLRGRLNDRSALIATLYGECRNQPVLGQIAVAWVIRNRAGGTGPGLISHVCMAPHQFSCWWGHDANTRAVYAFAQDLLVSLVPADRAVWRRLSWVADGVLGDCVDDPTGGATHYLTQHLYETAPPSWARRPATVTIGDHVFLS
jgi:N-acetylmuramoyl-L-alanine amidase